MKKPRSRTGTAAAMAVASPGRAGRWLGVAAFVLLAAAMTVRPVLSEMSTVQVTGPAGLMSPSPLWWNSSPAVMYIAHAMAAVGLLLGVLAVVLPGRPWRFTGLEPAVAILAVAAIISIPGASDRRLAINVAIGTIVPIAAAVVLVQLLTGRDAWRRALVAALLAAAAANCFRATRQRLYENAETWQYYQEHKAEYWARQGRSLDDPVVQIYESRIKSAQPLGYFYHPNVMASFLLVGMTAAGAAMVGAWVSRSRRKGRGVSPEADGTPSGPGASAASSKPANQPLRDARRSPPENRGLLARTIQIPWMWIALAVMAGLILWQLLVIYWVGSVGARAGLILGTAVGVVMWRWRRRPARAALAVLAILAVLQVTLVVLASRADSVVPSLLARGGKFKSMAFRLDYWHGALDLFAREPVRGVGPGQFGRDYLSVKPIRAPEETAHPHNWLLAVAAEWGIPGLLGVIAALVLPVWLALRHWRHGTVAGPPPPAVGQPGVSARAMVLACAIVLVCWLVVLPGVVPAGSAMFLLETIPAMPLALVVAALATIPVIQGQAALVVLLAGLAAFFVHAAAEMSSAVPGAMWPFWTLAAVALSCWYDSAETQRAGRVENVVEASGWRVLARPAFVSAALGALAIMILTVGPIRSIVAMGEAKTAMEGKRPVDAVVPLQHAAAVDSLDPAPRSALAELCRRLAYASRKDAKLVGSHLLEAVKQAQAATELDQRSNTLWSDLAWTSAELAAVTQDWNAVQQALTAMRRAVELYPNWPRGHFKYGMLLAGASDPPDLKPDLLRQALDEFDLAGRQNEQWPADDPNKFTTEDLSNLQARRRRAADLLRQAAATYPAPAGF